MRFNSHHRFLFGSLLLGASFLNATAQDKSDLILEELKQLRASIERLENRIATLEDQDSRLLTLVDAAAEKSSETTAESPNLIGRVVDAITVRDEGIRFPWLESSLWDQLKEGMSAAEVKAILGDPTLEDPSLHPRRDLVFTYRGTRLSTGKRVTGKVKFWRDKVVVIERPDFSD